MTESTPARTTPDNPVPAHGCMIDGQPAMPILIGEYNELVARVASAETAAQRMTSIQGRCPACGWSSLFLGDGGHVTCSRLECPNPSAADDLLHATPGPEATQATERDCLFRRDGCRPCNATDQCATCDRPVPQLPKFTVVHVTPEMERAATERARQMAEAHEEAEGSLVLAFGGQAGDHPSRRAGLRDLLAAAIWERQNPGRRYADCESPWHADAEEDANTVLALLYEEWPWLRAEAEDADTPAWTPPPPGSTRERLPAALLALINLPDYVSTACQTAIHLEAGPAPTPTSGGAIPDVGRYVDRLHARCRKNQKFTGQLCICRCHATKEN